MTTDGVCSSSYVVRGFPRWSAMVLSALFLSSVSNAEDLEQRRFDWDIISLEQNNNRFNGSVLSGFHSIRSPGVTPAGAWKTGLGVLFSHEEQTATSGGSQRSLETDLLIINPKINYGFYERFEIGLGLEANYATGETVDKAGGGSVTTEGNDNFNLSSAVGGVKWNFFRGSKLRVATSFDTRVATRKEQFGMLPATVFNFEFDADYAVTRALSIVSNLQLMTSDETVVNDQVVFDLAADYSFSDEFRGMLFGTIQEDDEADAAVLFFGLAGQYVFEQHSFTLALDFQLNDARREVRTESQIDLEFSYTFTF